MKIGKTKSGYIYYVDENLNKWDINKFTKIQAKQNSIGLKNCNNCVNCSNCINCDSCIDCISCNKCEDCFNCINCRNCYECRDLVGKNEYWASKLINEDEDNLIWK